MLIKLSNTLRPELNKYLPLYNMTDVLQICSIVV